MPNPTPAILEAANRFRAQLLARERIASSGLVRYYGRIWQQLQGDIRYVQSEVERKRAADQEISQGQIWRMQRLKAIQAQADRELARFAEFADDTITAGQRESIIAGERNARDLMLAAFPADAGVDVSFAAMPREAVESLVGFLADGSPLRKLLVKGVGDAAQGFADMMVTGLAAGWNPRKLARELRSQFGMGLTRALRIARTEQLRAYRTASLRAYQGSDTVVKWERMAAQDDRTCMACVMLDGKEYELNEPMDDHVQGRCVMLPITKSYAEMGIDAPEPDFSREKGEDWFRALPPEQQEDMMGKGMFAAWKRGEFQLSDIPKLRESSVWGDSWVPKGLGELVKGLPVGAQVPHFATVLDAENWLRENIAGVQRVSLTGFELEHIQPIVEQIQYIQSKYGTIPGIESIESVTGTGAIAQMRGARFLELNPEATVAYMNRQIDAGFFASRRGWRGVIDHELGHAFTPHVFDVTQPGAPMTEFGTRLDRYWKANQTRIRRELSGYASVARQEFVAEAFAARESGKAPAWVLNWLSSEGI